MSIKPGTGRKSDKTMGKIQLPVEHEISLWLDTYDDIFSDFDPRPYSERALSDDFLAEAKRATRDKPTGAIELKLLLPEAQRNINQENIIKHRLKEHFQKHNREFKRKRKELALQGIAFVLLGVALMFIASLILFKTGEDSLGRSFLIVLFEPAGWFLFWEGLNLVIFESKKIQPDYLFYDKMSRSQTQFNTY